MQTVTVAITDFDHDRRADCENLLQNESGIKLLKNIPSNTEIGSDLLFVNRRLKPRENVTMIEDEVARIKRLDPHVMLVNMDSFADNECVLLLSLRRECPESLMILTTDDSVRNKQIIHALELGVRGYLRFDTIQQLLANAVRVVGRGDAWIPRKLLGNIMDYMLIQ